MLYVFVIHDHVRFKSSSTDYVQINNEYAAVIDDKYSVETSEINFLSAYSHTVLNVYQRISYKTNEHTKQRQTRQIFKIHYDIGEW